MLQALALPADLTLRGGQVALRRAEMGDLHALMRLLSDDPISAARGDVDADADQDAYASGLSRIIADASNELIVAVDAHRRVIAMLQLTAIPGVARRGSTRLLVEAVRVAGDHRSAGLGSAMMRWVTEVAAPACGATLVQLTSDRQRHDAHRFYLRLGFVDSHVGFKYHVAGSVMT
ncbi:GNAT family N-acetyltransferase [Microbacterium hibisci]|uniref:GNAT family N-acetyltransferase n=1 Tax=Microbacterium hibisci TaxID=2036000 RepID=UPI001942E24F|nr:GNAT family N-acetyltransferase [Microbacterium hibisci]